MKKLFVIFLMFIISCTKQEKNDSNLGKNVFFTQFEKEYSIEGEQILFDNVKALAIYQIDDYILTKQVNDSIFNFKIYNKKDLTFLKDFGLKEGPNGFKTLSFNRQHIKENDSLKIWLYDFAKSVFLKVNLSKIIHNKSPDLIIEKKIDIDRTIFPPSGIFYVNDSIVVGDSGPDDIKKVRLRSFNYKNNKIIKETDLFPTVLNLKKLNLSMAGDIYHSYIRFYNNKFVSAMDYFNRVDIFDLDLNLQRSIIDKSFNSKRLKDISQLNLNHPSPLENLTVFYADISLGAKYIYTLYYNQLDKNYSKPKPTEIRVFDWDGSPKFVLKIPEYLMNISVDEESGFIYGTAFFEEKIMRYDINQIFRNI